ncbi:porin [Sulfitobacter sp. JL08]|uniref:porin n=1 Tax=Sulfitobacter sp. JL08 TaxID=2070369 RepID=UPI000E0AD178|nr:porin [Sulfitobacter sp. JL08]AXI53177.1 porin [Sulfitobacter sp. JL08]
MKKVLFATTALVATAGVAAADVTFGGYGRFGAIYTETKGTAGTPGTATDQTQIDGAQVIVNTEKADLAAAQTTYNDAVSSGTATPGDLAAVVAAEADLKVAEDNLAGLAGTPGTDSDDGIDIESRYRLIITATTESDVGVTFGAMVRIQQNESEAEANDNGINAARFFARAGNLEVGVGNIFGALEYMSGQYVIDLGLTGLGYEYVAYDVNGDYYSSGSAGSAPNAVEVIYSMGDFAFHASASDVNDRRAIVAQYTASDWTFALGWQDSDLDSDTELTASVVGSLGIADVGFAWADNGTEGDRYVLSGRVEVGASTDVEGYITYVDGGDDPEDTGYGIDFNHSLGGGASIRGGVAQRLNDTIIADLGVRFNF